MISSPVLTIAHKEFSDIVSDKKLRYIFLVLLCVTVIGSFAGVNTFNYQSVVYSQNLTTPANNYAPPVQPSVMITFFTFFPILAITCSLLGIAIGYDQFIKERSQNSLKLLLSLPIFRDEVIKGKAIGGLAVLFLAIICSFAITGITILINGIVPQGRDIALIFLYFIAIFLLTLTYYSIGMITTVFTFDSKKALGYAIIIFVLFSSLLPMMVQGNGPKWVGSVSEIILGPPPDIVKDSILAQKEIGEKTQGIENAAEISKITDDIFKKHSDAFFEGSKGYFEKTDLIYQILIYISPNMKINNIANSFTYPVKRQNYSNYDPFETRANEMTLDEIISGVIFYFLMLLIFPLILLGISYIKFMRIEVR